MNGLDLFSGIGGITQALAPWVTPVAYCEVDPHAQRVLLRRMASGELPAAPIWDDVRTLGRDRIPLPVDVIYGGFPCQDLSVAGRGAGLAGSRSGLFFEISRLAREFCPTFIFLENVPAIRTRGLDVVLKELASLGFHARWTSVSADFVGAPHRRERWFLLASHPDRLRLWDRWQRREEGQAEAGDLPKHDGQEELMAHSVRDGLSSTEVGRSPCEGNERCEAGENGGSLVEGRQEAVRRKSSPGEGGCEVANADDVRQERRGTGGLREEHAEAGGGREEVPDPDLHGQRQQAKATKKKNRPRFGEDYWRSDAGPFGDDWFRPQPAMGGGPDGLSSGMDAAGTVGVTYPWEEGIERVCHPYSGRVEEIRQLGNAVVPRQVRTAWQYLMGF